METELITYLDRKFSTVYEKIDKCAKQEKVDDLDKRLRDTEGLVKTHRVALYSQGAAFLTWLGAYFGHWFEKH